MGEGGERIVIREFLCRYRARTAHRDSASWPEPGSRER
jgi:hypothetical protein